MTSLDFLMSRRLQRVLAVVLLSPDRELSLSDLIRAGGEGRGATQAVVGKLFGAGILDDRRVGNQRMFKANKAHPLYADLRSIALKTFGLAEPIREALSTLEDRIALAFVFGSLPNGSDRPDSDVDLMLVGDLDPFDVAGCLEVAERALGRPIHANIHDPAEWEKLRTDRIVSKIVGGPKIMVFGNEPGRDAGRSLGEPDQGRQPQGG